MTDSTPNHLRSKPQQYDFDPTLEPERDAVAPAAVVTRPAVAKKSPPKERVLIDKKNLDDTLPHAKALAAALGWLNSIVTTMFTAAQIQTFITDHPASWIAWAAGFVAAALITFGQIYTSGRNRVGYAVLLFPDALMTSVQWCQWVLLPLMLKLLPHAWALAVIIAAIIGGIIGIVSARLPERLTFGK